MRKAKNQLELERGVIIQNTCLNCDTIFLSATSTNYLKDHITELVPDIMKHNLRHQHNTGPDIIIKERVSVRLTQNYLHTAKAIITNKLKTHNSTQPENIIVCGKTTIIGTNGNRLIEYITNTTTPTENNTPQTSTTPSTLNNNQTKNDPRITSEKTQDH